MTEVLEQKVLRGGYVVLIESYPIDDESCRIMQRPLGSREIVIALEIPDGRMKYNTPPEVSKYLTEKHYRKLFDAIRSVRGFEKVHDFLLREINTEESVEELDGFIHRLLSV